MTYLVPAAPGVHKHVFMYIYMADKIVQSARVLVCLQVVMGKVEIIMKTF